MLSPPPTTPDVKGARTRGVQILAKSIFRELKAQGYDERQIVGLATELISEVTSDMESRSLSVSVPG